MVELGHIGITQQVGVHALGVGLDPIGQVPQQVRVVDVAHGQHASAAEHFAADIVAIHCLEIGLGRGDGAVIETDRDHRGVEKSFVLVVRCDQGIGHHKKTSTASAPGFR
nr:hypothetical protein GCM10020185_85590 [Pseudomonas brassicacearum subsp. brassicacearum]